ncbi:exodeoxyribonuclease V subunit gamma [Candidatus Venteria ishoeyi]
MIVHTSNRLEILFGAFADNISAPLPPLGQERVLVQSHGMGADCLWG